MKFLVIQGPNLNVLGHRDPRMYGNATLQQIHAGLQEAAKSQVGVEGGLELEFFQSNHEGELIDRLQECIGSDIDGVIINPGGLSHTSISLADAIVACGVPIIEVHLSNIHAREERRNHSITGSVSIGVIAGLGPLGYHLAMIALVNVVREIRAMNQEQK